MNSDLVISNAISGHPIKICDIDLNVGDDTSGCYVIFCDKTSMYYVGSSLDCKKRKYTHFNEIKNKNHSNPGIMRDSMDYGKDSFHFILVEECLPFDLEKVEQKWWNLIGEDRLYNANRIARRTNKSKRELANNMDNRKLTLKEWAIESNLNPDNVRRRAPYPVRLTSVLTYQEWTEIRKDKKPGHVVADNGTGNVPAIVRPIVPVKKLDVPASPAGMVGAVVRKAEPPSPFPQVQESEPTFADVRAWFRDALLISLVVGHAGLVWYDCGRLWDVPGTIAGGLAFGLIVATLMFATDASKNLTSQWALLLALLVDAGAYWVHYPVFSQYDAPEAITRVLCVFLCAMSFGALFLFRHQKNN